MPDAVTRIKTVMFTSDVTGYRILIAVDLRIYGFSGNRVDNDASDGVHLQGGLHLFSL